MVEENPRPTGSHRQRQEVERERERERDESHQNQEYSPWEELRLPQNQQMMRETSKSPQQENLNDKSMRDDDGV